MKLDIDNSERRTCKLINSMGVSASNVSFVLCKYFMLIVNGIELGALCKNVYNITLL